MIRLGLPRRPAGAAAGAPQRRSAYAGAAFSRLTLDWITSALSADAEARADLWMLRARSRELDRNNPIAHRYFGMVATNVAGPRGMTLQMRLGSAAGRPFETLNDAVEEAFAEWACPATASLDGRLSWAAIQRLIASGRARDGEALLQLVTLDPVASGNRFGFALKPLDPDLLDHAYNLPPGTDRNEVRMGVEIDADGRPVAYWLWSAHPGDYANGQRRRVRVPAEQIVHWYRPTRIGLTRGIPDLAPVMSDLKLLGGAKEAELVAMRAAAAKMGFFVEKGDEGPAIDPNTGQPFALPPQLDASPGTVDFAPPGYEFQPWDPQHPTANFAPFVKSAHRDVAAGLGVAYHNLASDLESVNYSSARVGELDERDEWAAQQWDMIEHVCDVVFDRWLQAALLAGAIDLPSRDWTKYRAHEFVPRRWEWVDPKNEVEAAVYAIQNGLGSRTRVLAQQGIEIDDVFRDLAREEADAARLKISVTSAPSPKALNSDTQDGTPASGGKPEPTDMPADRRLRLARAAY